MARLPKFERRSSDESSDSNLLAIVGVGVAAIVGMLLLTGQFPPGGGTEEEEPAPIPAGTGATTGTSTEGDTGTQPPKGGKQPKGTGKTGAPKKKSDAKKKDKGTSGTGAPPTGSGGSVTDRYLDCIATAKGKRQIQRCVDLIEGAGG